MNVSKRVDLRAFREDPYQLRFRVRGYNLTGATMAFAVRLYPNAPGDAEIEIGNTTTRGAEGIRIVDTGVTDGFDWTDVEIIIAKATVSALPTVGEAGADDVFAYDFEWERADTGSGFSEEETTILFGDFIVRGSVNNG